METERDGCLSADRMPLDELQMVMSRILGALGRVHELGFFYCDMKPGNVICFSDGRWGVIDYGSVIPVGTWMQALNFSYTDLYIPPEMATTLTSW